MNGAIIDAAIVIGTPVIRGCAGWLQNSLADGEINEFEWKKLAETVLRLGVPAAALYYGFNVPAQFAAAVPLVVDYAFKYIEKVVAKIKAKK